MGQIIKYTNKGFLREHPFDDPLIATSPVQTRSFMFPGDEIVAYHKLSLPGDASTASINNIHLVSAKVSIIAQKPQVFSEEFNFVFKSTRNFVLDSFETTFNNFNAPVIPWGADGNAPLLTLTQDRNFRLPSGDFRRRIKFFTQHAGGTSVWDYYFYFPILFRWEYWIGLLGVNNDFYDNTLPLNGQNNWWYHYFVNGIWTIKSRLELTITVNGTPTIIRSELNLTQATGDVNDYNSNPEYIVKSIKTSAVGGVPSNSPCLINGNKNTEVYAYFSKVTPWIPDEQRNLSAVLWVEPYQGAGTSARTRGSSMYQATSESVFAGLNTSITDDSGTGIQDALGNYIVTDGYGNGAIVFFDGVNSEKVTVFGIIDYNKLALAYPGVTQFTLYARLYNSTIIGGRTKKGEELKQDAVLISTFDDSSLCGSISPPCPFDLVVFADSVDRAYLKNDKSDFYQYGDRLFSAITFILQKNDSVCGTGSWTDVATITQIGDNGANNSSTSYSAYGKFFPFGKSPNFGPDDFMDDYGKKYTGLMLEWRNVLIAFGTGMYRMKIVKTDVFTNVTTSYDQRVFCLKNYNCNLIDRTVRIETLNRGLLGSLFNNRIQIDYGTGWNGQMRLKGVMKFKSSGYTKEHVQYGDGKFNAFRPNVNDQNPKFSLSIRPIPGWMDWKLSTEVLQADEILITDYNVANRHTFRQTPVMNDGEFTPRDNSLRNALSDVEIALAYGQNNLRKRNSG